MRHQVQTVADPPLDVLDRSDRVDRGRARRRWWLLAVIGTAVGLMVLVGSAAEPSSAQALSIPNPIHVAGSVLGGVLSGVTGGIADLAVQAFTAIVKALFEPLAKFINTELIGWLISVPNYAQGNVRQLEQTVTAMGGAALAAVATISIARFWVAGLAVGGGQAFDAMQGLARTIGAALMLTIWPWLFEVAVRLSDAASTAVMGAGSVTDDSARLLAAGFGAGVGVTAINPMFGLFLAIVVAAGASLLFLALLLVKIMLGVSTILVFVGMPAAIVLWPVVPWIANVLARAFAVCLIVPFVWALCFAASAAVNVNVLEFQGGGGVFDKLLQPLVALMLLWVMVTLPRKLGHLAMLGGSPHGAGFLSRTVSYAAGSQLRETVRQQISTRIGSRRGDSEPPSPRSESPRGSRLRTAATVAAAATAGPAAAAAASADGASVASDAATNASKSAGPAAGTATRATTGNGLSYTPPASATRALGAGEGGLQAPSFAGRERDMDNELLEAKVREQVDPVSVAQARAAVEALPEATRQGVAQLDAQHGSRTREHLAYQALGEWTPEQRDALRTLAAATPQVRDQALRDYSIQPDGAGHGGVPSEQPIGSTPAASVSPAPIPPATPRHAGDDTHQDVGGQPPSPPRDPQDQPRGNGGGESGRAT